MSVPDEHAATADGPEPDPLLRGRRDRAPSGAHGPAVPARSADSRESAERGGSVGPSEPTPREHLLRLLARSLNSFELPGELLPATEDAVAYAMALHSAHHSAGLDQETFRHTWLLADGAALTLFELRRGLFPDGSGVTDHCEVFRDEEEMTAVLSRLPFAPRTPAFELSADREVWADRYPQGDTPAPMGMPTWVPDDSADHARRLLRRAENADRPGPETAALLTGAWAHRITQAFGHPLPGHTGPLRFALYEHAFLLHDGCEVALWEVEHTDTPDGRHMCEVYTSTAAAHAAMRHRVTSDRPSGRS